MQAILQLNLDLYYLHTTAAIIVFPVGLLDEYVVRVCVIRKKKSHSKRLIINDPKAFWGAGKEGWGFAWF